VRSDGFRKPFAGTSKNVPEYSVRWSDIVKQRRRRSLYLQSEVFFYEISLVRVSNFTRKPIFCSSFVKRDDRQVNNVSDPMTISFRLPNSVPAADLGARTFVVT